MACSSRIFGDWLIWPGYNPLGRGGLSVVPFMLRAFCGVLKLEGIISRMYTPYDRVRLITALFAETPLGVSQRGDH